MMMSVNSMQLNWYYKHNQANYKRDFKDQNAYGLKIISILQDTSKHSYSIVERRKKYLYTWVKTKIKQYPNPSYPGLPELRQTLGGQI